MNRIFLAIGYLVFPFLIFCLGFLKWYVGIPIVGLFVYCSSRVCKEFSIEKDVLSVVQHFLLAGVSLLWCWHCGIGGFWVQHADFFVKNAVLRDLIHRPWPLRYDLSIMSDGVQQMIGSDEVDFVYYLFTYLPAAFVGRITHSELIGNICLLLWSSLGIYIMLTFLFNLITKRTSSNKSLLGIFFAILCFSGLEVIGPPLLDLCLGNDIIGHSWSNIKSLSIAKEMWCWPYFSMYGSLYSDMEIRFNQTVPIWVIMSLILQSRDYRYLVFFFSFLILYSPWACVGMSLMVCYVLLGDIWKQGCSRILMYLNIENIAFPIVLALIVGLYYSSNRNATSYQGWFFEYMSIKEFIIKYTLFFWVEVGVYLFFLRRELQDNLLLQASFVLLLILPFYRMTQSNDLLMCASIPAIFVIAISWFKWLKVHFVENNRIALVVFLLMTGLTPIEWLIAEDYHYLSGQSEKVKDYIHSFQEVKKDNAELCDQQFFAHNPESTIFWKYLAK